MMKLMETTGIWSLAWFLFLVSFAWTAIWFLAILAIKVLFVVGFVLLGAGLQTLVN